MPDIANATHQGRVDAFAPTDLAEPWAAWADPVRRPIRAAEVRDAYEAFVERGRWRASCLYAPQPPRSRSFERTPAALRRELARDMHARGFDVPVIEVVVGVKAA